MRDIFLTVYRGYAKVLWFFAMLAGAATFAIMWIIDINVLTRKVFNAPLTGGIELTQSLLTAAIMLPFGYALLQRDHVSTVLFTSTLPPRIARILETAWMLAGCLLFAFVTYGTFKYALRSYSMNEQVWGANIRFPLWPAKMAISAGALLLSIQFLLDFARGLIFGDDDTLHESVAEHASRHSHV